MGCSTQLILGDPALMISFGLEGPLHRRRKQGGEGGGRPPRFLV